MDLSEDFELVRNEIYKGDPPAMASISRIESRIREQHAEVESLRERLKELEANWETLKDWLNRDKENSSGDKVSRAFFLMAELDDAMIKERNKG